MAAANISQIDRQGFITMNGQTYFMVETVDALGNKKFEPAKGVCQIDGYYYYFDELGKMMTGLHEVNGALYYFDENEATKGRVYSGYVTVGGVQYYCDPAEGGKARKV